MEDSKAFAAGIKEGMTRFSAYSCGCGLSNAASFGGYAFNA
ncbi:MAG: hypothetical protein ABWY08_10765 [Comamonas sp.]